MKPMPPTVNFHVLAACNMRCRFCFSRFSHNCDRDTGLEVIRLLAESGFEKITLAGGEPLLCGFLYDGLKLAKDCGMTTSIVTNGALLSAGSIGQYVDILDWLGLSVDSANEAVNRALGRAVRGIPLPREHYEILADSVKAVGIRLKVNTVVNRLNVSEDMRAMILRFAPKRWKIFQALPIQNQNGHEVGALTIDQSAFQGFYRRHKELENSGMVVVHESNADMSGTYAMLDPSGRFVDNSTGEHRYSRSILDVGVHAAWEEVHFDHEAFVRRGGLYDYAS